MPVYQVITVTDQTGGTILDDFDVTLNQLDSPGGNILTSVTYNSAIDQELLWSPDELIIDTSFGSDENLSGTITVRFELDGNICVDTVSFNPEFLICNPTAAGATEDFAYFVVSAAQEQAQIEDSGVDCLLFQVN